MKCRKKPHWRGWEKGAELSNSGKELTCKTEGNENCIKCYTLADKVDPISVRVNNTETTIHIHWNRTIK